MMDEHYLNNHLSLELKKIYKQIALIIFNALEMYFKGKKCFLTKL